MRIGLFTDTYPPYINGVSTSVSILKKALEKEGHQVFILTVNNEKIKYKYEDDNKIIRIPGVPIGIYDYRLTGIYPIQAINKIKKWNLDVIHSHTEFGVGTFARIIAKQLNIPLVHTYHTMYEDYLYYITKGHFDKPSKKIAEYYTKFFCDKTATELIVPTKKTEEFFKKKYKIKRDIHIIPTGIELDKFYRLNYKETEIEKYREKYNISTNDFVILFVGRIAEEKSVRFLIESHTEIIKNNPKVKLLIVGDGPEKYELEQLTMKLNLQNNIIFTGKVPFENIGYYYQIGNAFATASKSETQGLTVLEAMAASMPVVCINDPSFTQVVENKHNGLIFKNKKQYIKAILDLQDKNLLNELQKNCISTVEMYSSKKYAENVLKIYEKIVPKNKQAKSILDKLKFWRK